MDPNLFINREREQKFLNSIYNSEGRTLAILYGRRRVGKTELLSHFIKGKKAIYFLADKAGTKVNALRFAKLCAEHFNDSTPTAEDFGEVFTYIKNRVKNQKIIVVIDEFSYLVEKDDVVPSVFQRIVDQILKETNVMLVLCGSSISMMWKGTLSYSSPLYGRRTGDWMMTTMPFVEMKKFYKGIPFEEMVKIYGVVGGVPAYATNFNAGEIFETIKKDILTKGKYLYKEPEELLRQELRDPATYFAILGAMASKAKLTEIADQAHIAATDLPHYLKTLEIIELVERINPITEKKSKKTLYFIKDNFFRFWFKFIYPERSDLERGAFENPLTIIRRDFNAYTGKIFEQVCKEYLERNKPIPFNRIGKWWDSKNEIDVVAIDEDGKNILFAECKWQSNVNAVKIVEQLKQKTENVKWNNGNRKEHYAIFAKSFKQKPKMENVFLFDSTDLSKM